MMRKRSQWKLSTKMKLQGNVVLHGPNGCKWHFHVDYEPELLEIVKCIKNLEREKGDSDGRS